MIGLLGGGVGRGTWASAVAEGSVVLELWVVSGSRVVANMCGIGICLCYGRVCGGEFGPIYYVQSVRSGERVCTVMAVVVPLVLWHGLVQVLDVVPGSGWFWA